MSEFNLSEKIEEKMWAEDKNPKEEADQFGEGLWIEDVKEFIRLLKKEMKGHRFDEYVCAIIDKLAGEKLC